MKLLIETPSLEIRAKLENKGAIFEEDLVGLMLKEIRSISPTALGIKIEFRTEPLYTSEEIELVNSDFRLMHLYCN